jgi:hypothetical protein
VCDQEPKIVDHRLGRLTYQLSASGTFLSGRISHQQPDSSTFLLEQTSTSHQPNEQAALVRRLQLL